MAMVMPEADERTVKRVAHRSFVNFCKYIADFVRFPSLSQEDIRRKFLAHDAEWKSADELLAQGKGLIAVTMHFGNWDLAAASVIQRGYVINVIAERFKNRSKDRLAMEMRHTFGMKVIPMEKAAVGAYRALRKNEVLALLIDRPLLEAGVTVNFFGAPTRVPEGTARLALRTGAPILVIGLLRVKDDAVRPLLEPIPPLERTGDEEQDIQVLTQRIMDALEKMVRAYPEQWYMFRRMWAQPEPSLQKEEVLAR